MPVQGGVQVSGVVFIENGVMTIDVGDDKDTE